MTEEQFFSAIMSKPKFEKKATKGNISQLIEEGLTEQQAIVCLSLAQNDLDDARETYVK